jgi:hypothetical protein
MGDRFYQQQLNKLGTCPGFNGRKRKMAWTDEQREEAITQYEDANPTAENSMEIVKEIAEDMEQSPNGVRMILTRAGVYIKKAETSAKANGGGTARVSKAASQESLTAAIEDAGQTADQEIISKLTGKAAVYLTEIITAITN